jgi:hypothetical protein
MCWDCSIFYSISHKKLASLQGSALGFEREAFRSSFAAILFVYSECSSRSCFSSHTHPAKGTGADAIVE